MKCQIYVQNTIYRNTAFKSQKNESERASSNPQVESLKDMQWFCLFERREGHFAPAEWCFRIFRQWRFDADSISLNSAVIWLLLAAAPLCESLHSSQHAVHDSSGVKNKSRITLKDHFFALFFCLIFKYNMAYNRIPNSMAFPFKPRPVWLLHVCLCGSFGCVQVGAEECSNDQEAKRDSSRTWPIIPQYVDVVHNQNYFDSGFSTSSHQMIYNRSYTMTADMLFVLLAHILEANAKESPDDVYVYYRLLRV